MGYQKKALDEENTITLPDFDFEPLRHHAHFKSRVTPYTQMITNTSHVGYQKKALDAENPNKTSTYNIG